MRISSPTNPLVRRLRRLAESPRACREHRHTLAEGLHLVEAARAASVKIETLVVRSGASSSAQALAAQIAAEQPKIKQVELAAALYDSIAPVEHGVGILAELALPTPAPLRLTGDAVYLDGVQDPGNVGALVRTAAAAGVGSVIAGPGTAYAWSPKVLRAAMGAHFSLRLHDDVPLADVRNAFRGEVLVADLEGDDLYSASWAGTATLWIFGSEGQGLSAETRALSARRLRIPIAPGVESLNVAAAAAVCLFEQRRRRISAA